MDEERWSIETAKNMVQALEDRVVKPNRRLAILRQALTESSWEKEAREYLDREIAKLSKTIPKDRKETPCGRK